MENLSPIKKLDAVLNLLKSKTMDLSGLQTHLTLTDIDLDELRRITKKLDKDGYIETSAANSYLVTFDGYLFEGYENEKEVNDINQIIMANDDLLRLRNDALLVRGTWFLGVAAVLLLLWQVFLYVYPAYATNPYFMGHK